VNCVGKYDFSGRLTCYNIGENVSSSSYRIDLRPLEFAAVIDVNGLPSVENIEHCPAPLRWPFPVPFTPPNGMCASAPMVVAFTYVMPARRSRIA